MSRCLGAGQDRNFIPAGKVYLPAVGKQARETIGIKWALRVRVPNQLPNKVALVVRQIFGRQPLCLVEGIEIAQVQLVHQPRPSSIAFSLQQQLRALPCGKAQNLYWAVIRSEAGTKIKDCTGPTSESV